MRNEGNSSPQLAQKFLLVHTVLESLAPVDKHHGDLIVIKPSDFGVGVHVDLTPGKAASLMQLFDLFLNDFAEMTPLAGINDDLARLRHARECSSFGAGFPRHGRP